MKILVIGGAGYIGAHVCRELLKAGHSLTVYDNLSSGTKENIVAGTNFVLGDILDYRKLSSVMPGQDIVVHLAALKAAGESMINPEKFSTNNIIGTLNILNCMTEFGVRKIIFSSTAAVYGEPEFLPVTEAHPTNPINYYGFTKLEVERFLGWYSKLKGLQFVALRYFNAVGYSTEEPMVSLESKPQNLLPIIMEVLNGTRDKLLVFGGDYETNDGTCVRDYIHVQDLAEAHVKAVKFLTEQTDNLTVNLSTAEGLSVKEIVDEVKRQTKIDFKVEITSRRPGDPAILYADNSRARDLLDWKPKHSDIENIVETTLKAYGLK
jgi:UDP-glucose 4-epimerase